MSLPEQRLERRTNAAAINATEIAAENGLVDLPRAARIPRQQLAVKLRRPTVGTRDPAARDRDASRPLWCGDRPLDAAIPIPSTPVGALVRLGAEGGGELFGEGRV